MTAAATTTTNRPAEHKPTDAAARQPAPGASAAAPRDTKSALRGKTFGEQEAMLAPGADGPEAAEKGGRRRRHGGGHRGGRSGIELMIGEATIEEPTTVVQTDWVELAETSKLQLTAIVEEAIANKDEQRLRAYMTRLGDVIKTQPEGHGLYHVVLEGVPYLVDRATLGALHTRLTTEVAKLGPAVPVMMTQTAPETRWESVMITDENNVNEHLANYELWMQVGVAYGGQPYLIQPHTHADRGSGGASLGFTNTVTSSAIATPTEKMLDVTFAVDFNGSSKTQSDSVGVSTTAKSEYEGLEQSLTVNWAMTNSNTAVEGARFVRAFRIKVGPDGKLVWTRKGEPFANASRVPLTRVRDGVFDSDSLLVSTWDGKRL